MATRMDSSDGAGSDLEADSSAIRSKQRPCIFCMLQSIEKKNEKSNADKTVASRVGRQFVCTFAKRQNWPKEATRLTRAEGIAAVRGIRTRSRQNSMRCAPTWKTNHRGKTRTCASPAREECARARNNWRQRKKKGRGRQFFSASNSICQERERARERLARLVSSANESLGRKFGKCARARTRGRRGRPANLTARTRNNRRREFRGGNNSGVRNFVWRRATRRHSRLAQVSRAESQLRRLR